MIYRYAHPKSKNARLQPLIEESFGIISMYATKGATIRALYSGGKDSAIVAHLGSFHPDFAGVGHVRTLTGPQSERHSDKVHELSILNGWQYIEASPTETFDQIVVAFGFPGPAAHEWMYIRLKERAIRKIKQMAIKGKDRVIYLSGIRHAESTKRKDAPEFKAVGGNEWWINPILKWTDEDVYDYVSEFGLKVPSWGHSLDCFCGSYATPEEKELLKYEAPDQYEYIQLLESIAKAGHSIQVMGKKTPFPREFCQWGHGLNKEDIRKAKADVMICNDCNGRLAADGTGNAGVDPDALMRLHRLRVQQVNARLQV